MGYIIGVNKQAFMRAYEERRREESARKSEQTPPPSGPVAA